LAAILRARPVRVGPGGWRFGTVPAVPALDGIRGVAVLAVLLYHLDLPWAGGGFLGVEVFFTLSGFLITQLLVAEMRRRGRFDVWGFAKARARRLVPALVVCVLVTVLLDALLRPGAAPDLRDDALASLLFAQNWHLVLAGIPYSEASTAPSPLLHLWSLGVEAQLYVLWPLVLLGVVTLRSRASAALVATSLAILSALAMAMSYDPDGGALDYYQTPLRASGFLVGAALALLWTPEHWTRPRPWWSRAVVDAAGVAALMALLLAFGTASEFDSALYRQGEFLRVGLVTAVIVLAATTSGGSLAHLLGGRALAAVGRRSYGLYLYHWPLLVVAREVLDTGWSDAAAILATVALTEVSYRAVETPVRRGAIGAFVRARRLRRPTVATLSVGTAALAGAAVVALTVPLEPQAPAAGTMAAPPSAAPTSAAAPATTAAPATPTPATPTPATPPAGPVLVVGDSIALGSADALRTALGGATTVNAKVGRQFSAAPEIVRAWVAANAGPVVVDLGANGTISPDDLAAVLAATGDRRLVLVGVHVPRRWSADDNSTLRAAAAGAASRVGFVDWDAIVTAHPGILGPDGVHPGPQGRTLLADAVVQALAA
jgi:peptidoglycan/LPS O-acetylase OafA/YrhL